VAVETATMGDLIPRGDDFGAHPEASEAIVAACRNGWLLNVSVLVTAAGARDAVAQLASVPGICRGLHLCLSSEWTDLRWGPITRHADLSIADGSCPTSPAAVHHADVALDVVMAEVAAQAAEASRIGLRIDYLDEHMGCSWIRPASWGGDRRLHDHLQEWCDAQGIVYHFDCYQECVGSDAAARADSLIAAAAASAETLLYMTHPAHARGAIARDRIRERGEPPGEEAALREIDFRMLSDHSVRERLQDRGVRLLRFSDAPRGYRKVVRFP
jgi:predicted glycoside hydrolase/deacetylase ChbG (UPF0249 family)